MSETTTIEEQMADATQAYLESLEGSSFENFDALYWTTLSINEWRNEWYESKGFDRPEQVDFRTWDEVRDWFISQESHHFIQTMEEGNLLGVEAGETRGIIVTGAIDEAAGISDVQIYNPEDRERDPIDREKRDVAAERERGESYVWIDGKRYGAGTDYDRAEAAETRQVSERSELQAEYDWMLDVWEREVRSHSEWMASAAILPGDPDPYGWAESSENWTYTIEEDGMVIGGDREEFIGQPKPGSWMAREYQLPLQGDYSISPHDFIKEVMIFIGTGLIINPLIGRLGPTVGRVFNATRQGLRQATTTFSEASIRNRAVTAIITGSDDAALAASHIVRTSLNLGDEASYQAITMGLTDDLVRVQAITQGEAALVNNLARLRPDVTDAWLVRMNADPNAFKQAAQKVDDALKLGDDPSLQAFQGPQVAGPQPPWSPNRIRQFGTTVDDAMNIADDVMDDVMTGVAGWGDETVRFSPAAIERNAQLASSPFHHPLYPPSNISREQLELTARALNVKYGDDVVTSIPLKQRVYEAQLARQQQKLPIISYSTQGEIQAARLPVLYQSRSPAVIERTSQALTPYQSRVPALREPFNTRANRLGYEEFRGIGVQARPVGGLNPQPLPLHASRFQNFLRRGDASTFFGAARHRAADFIDESLAALDANAIWAGLSTKQRTAFLALGITSAGQLGDRLSGLFAGDGSEADEAGETGEGTDPSTGQASGDQAQIELDSWTIDQRTEAEATEHFIRAISQLDSTTLGTLGTATALQESLEQGGSIRTGSLHSSETRTKWNDYWTNLDNWDAVVENEELYAIVKRLVGEANPEIDLNKEWEVRQFLASTDNQESHIVQPEDLSPTAAERGQENEEVTQTTSEDLRSSILLNAANTYAASKIERDGPNVTIVGSGSNERFLWQGALPEIEPGQEQFVTSPTQQLGILENTMFDLFSNGAVSHANAGAQIQNISQNQETWETVVRTLYGLGYLRYIGKNNDKAITSDQLQHFINNPHLYNGNATGDYAENIIQAWAALQFDIEMSYNNRYQALSLEGREDFQINDVLLNDVAVDLVQRAIGENEDSVRSRMTKVDREVQQTVVDDVINALLDSGYNLEGDALKRVEDAVTGRLAETFETRVENTPGTYTERQFAENLLDGFWNMHSIEGETRDLGDSFMLPDWAFGSQGNDIIDLIQLDEFDLLPEACYEAIQQGDLQKARMLVDKESIKQIHINHMVSMMPDLSFYTQSGGVQSRDLTSDDLYMAAMEYLGTIPGSIHYVPNEKDIRELANSVFAEHGGGTAFGEDPMIQELSAEVSEEELEDKQRFYNPDLVAVMNTINQTTGQRRSRGSIFQNR